MIVRHQGSARTRPKVTSTPNSRLSTYSGRYPNNDPRFPFFIVAPVFAASKDGTATAAIEGDPDVGKLVYRSPTGTTVLTENFDWNHLSRIAQSPDGQTLVATLARFQDDRYCGTRPWRTFVWHFDQ